MGCAGVGGCHESSSWLYSKHYHPGCALVASPSAVRPDQAILLMPSSLTSYLENKFAGWAAAEEQCFRFWLSSPGHECRMVSGMWLWCLHSRSAHPAKEARSGGLRAGTETFVGVGQKAACAFAGSVGTVT